MSLNAETKAAIVAEYARCEGDTGSPEVQVAHRLLLSTTCKVTSKNTKAITTAVVVFLRMVSSRRKLLDYLKGKDLDRCHDLIKRLGPTSLIRVCQAGLKKRGF